MTKERRKRQVRHSKNEFVLISLAACRFRFVPGRNIRTFKKITVAPDFASLYSPVLSFHAADCIDDDRNGGLFIQAILSFTCTHLSSYPRMESHCKTPLPSLIRKEPVSTTASVPGFARANKLESRGRPSHPTIAPNMSSDLVDVWRRGRWMVVNLAESRQVVLTHHSSLIINLSTFGKKGPTQGKHLDITTTT